MAAGSAEERLLGLLGLARRAGQLAVGGTAVEKMVARGRRPLVIVARDCGAALRNKALHLEPVRGFLVDLVEREDLARVLGRNKLAVVAVADHGFVDGIKKLGLQISGPENLPGDNRGEG